MMGLREAMMLAVEAGVVIIPMVEVTIYSENPLRLAASSRIFYTSSSF